MKFVGFINLIAATLIYIRGVISTYNIDHGIIGIIFASIAVLHVPYALYYLYTLATDYDQNV